MILNGATSVTVTVTPLDDTTNESSETVILTLSSNANYTWAASTNATVNITSNDPLVTVTASDASAAESPLRHRQIHLYPQQHDQCLDGLLHRRWHSHAADPTSRH